MNAIKKFEIVGMSASGFKCYGETISAEFGNPTVITGGNGRGKSSVADAIAFAITGKFRWEQGNHGIPEHRGRKRKGSHPLPRAA